MMNFQPSGAGWRLLTVKVLAACVFETWAAALDPDLGTYIVYWGPPLDSESAPGLSKLVSMLQVSPVVSDSLWPHGLQHARPPCPSPTPRACPNSCPSSRWCHPTISSSVVPFSSCLQSVPASRSFQKSQFFTSGGRSIGALVSAPVLPTNSQGSFPLGSTGLISLLSKGLSRVFSSIIVWKHQFFGTQPSLWSSSHLYMTTGKAVALTAWSVKWCLCFWICYLGWS